MSPSFFHELSNSDLAWFKSVGQQVEIDQPPIVQSGQTPELIYLIIEGSFSVSLPQTTPNTLNRAFSALEENTDLEQVLYTLQSGEFIGEEFLLNLQSPTTTVRSQTPSRLLQIPKALLQAKLQQDLVFAARLYRSLAQSLSERLLSFKQNKRPNKFIPAPLERDILIAFTELHDRDLDWLLANGNYQQIPDRTFLLEAGKPAEAFYILLKGAMKVTTPLETVSSLDRGFEAFGVIASSPLEEAITTLQSGEFIGELPFGEPRLASKNVYADGDCSVLAIPTSTLQSKLQDDDGWTVRFERVVARLASRQLREEIQRLGYHRRYYSAEETLDPAVTYDDELDFATLNTLTLAGTHFNWMRDQLQNQVS